jgi:hypothetical protein
MEMTSVTILSMTLTVIFSMSSRSLELSSEHRPSTAASIAPQGACLLAQTTDKFLEVRLHGP